VVAQSLSFEVKKGEAFGIVGPNGAGNSTLLNLVNGNEIQDSGNIVFNGVNLNNLKSSQRSSLGIARTFQNIRLFADMTACENVMVGRHVRTHQGILGAILRHPAARKEEAEIKQRAHELLEFVGIAHLADRAAKHLSYGDQRRLEIARALATDPILLALDEPAAGMNHSEKDNLHQLLLKIKAQCCAILLIEHDVKLMMSICDRITVLDYGKIIAEGEPHEIQKNPAVLAAYLGGEVA
jgi:branched-chain amino acid transport system ATP-binding protein